MRDTVQTIQAETSITIEPVDVDLDTDSGPKVKPDRTSDIVIETMNRMQDIQTDLDSDDEFMLRGMTEEERKMYMAELQKDKVSSLSDTDVVENPFYVSLIGGTAIRFPKRDFYTSYDYCFALRLADNQTESITMDKINRKTLTFGELSNICKNLTLEKVSIKLLHNNRFKRTTNLVSGLMLYALFGKNSTQNPFQDAEFVVPFHNINQKDALNYLSLYRVQPGLSSLASVMKGINSFNPDYTTPIDKSVQSILTGMDSNAYWTQVRNCAFPLFEIFAQRCFAYNGLRLDTIKADTLRGAQNIAKNINQLIDSIENAGSRQKIRRQKRVTKSDYPLPGNDLIESNMHNPMSAMSAKSKTKKDDHDKAEFQNLYKVLKNQEHRTFYVTQLQDQPTEAISKEDISDIFDRITSEKFRFRLFNTLLTSKEHCHLVYNNKRVLERNADLFEKYKPFYSYAMFYAHLTMYLEESILSVKTVKYHRHVFDLETANALPSFPFSKTDVRRSPYVTLLLPDDVIDSQTNFVGLETPYEYAKYMGLASPAEAKQRFNIFCTGYADKDLFDISGIDQSKIAVSGSVMPACLQKLPLLFEKCTAPDVDYEVRWKTFFKHFYGDSDIDLMCACTTMSRFILYGSKFIEHLQKLGIERSEITIKPDKKSAIVIGRQFFVECVDDINSVMGSSYTTETLIELFKQVNHASYTDEFVELLQEYFYADYITHKTTRNKDWRAVKKAEGSCFDTEIERAFTSITPFDDFVVKMNPYDIPESTLKRNDNEIYFFVNDFRSADNQVDAEHNILLFKYSETLKFKVRSPKLMRDVELFKVRDMDPFNTVARFHLPNVRAYYQNNKFYMLPSFITAMHTGLNLDYKYFAGSRDPVNICYKYITRGFGIILNSSEKRGILTYSKAIDEYNGMYKIEKAEDVFGPKDLSHNFFCPAVFKMGLDKSIYVDPDVRYIENADDLRKIWKAESSYDTDGVINMLRINSVTKSGDVEPYKPWIADAFYDMANA